MPPGPAQLAAAVMRVAGAGTLLSVSTHLPQEVYVDTYTSGPYFPDLECHFEIENSLAALPPLGNSGN